MSSSKLKTKLKRIPASNALSRTASLTNPQVEGKGKRKSVCIKHPLKRSDSFSKIDKGVTNIFRESKGGMMRRSSNNIKHFIAKSIENRSFYIDLANNLEMLAFREPITSEKFSIYQKSFEKFISANQKYANLLHKIKTAYEQYIQTKESEISELKKEIEDEKMVFNQLNLRFKALALENIELNNSFNQLRSKMDDLKEQNCFNTSEQCENKYKLQLERTINKYQKLKLSYRKLNKVLSMARQKGFPVDSLKSEINPLNNEKLWIEAPSYQDSSLFDKDSMQLFSDNQHEKEVEFEANSGTFDFRAISPIIDKHK